MFRPALFWGMLSREHSPLPRGTRLSHQCYLGAAAHREGNRIHAWRSPSIMYSMCIICDANGCTDVSTSCLVLRNEVYLRDWRLCPQQNATRTEQASSSFEHFHGDLCQARQSTVAPQTAQPKYDTTSHHPPSPSNTQRWPTRTP